jgi:hypothetical protein
MRQTANAAARSARHCGAIDRQARSPGTRGRWRPDRLRASARDRPAARPTWDQVDRDRFQLDPERSPIDRTPHTGAIPGQWAGPLGRPAGAAGRRLAPRRASALDPRRSPRWGEASRRCCFFFFFETLIDRICPALGARANRSGLIWISPTCCLLLSSTTMQPI